MSSLAFSKLAKINGDFTISNVTETELKFPELKEIKGQNMTFSYIRSTNNLKMPLESFGDGSKVGKITITENSCPNRSNEISFNRLKELSAEIYIGHNTTTSVFFYTPTSTKEGVKSSITINDSSYTSFSALQTMNGDITLKRGTGIPVQVYFDALETINGELSIPGRYVNYSFPKLKSVKNLTINSSTNSDSQKIDFPSLTTINNNLTIDGKNDNVMTEIKFETLTDIGNALTIKNFAELSRIDIPNLSKIIIQCCPQLTVGNCNLGENTCTILPCD